MRFRKRACGVSEFPQALGRSEVSDVHDQRIEAWSSLGFVNAGDRFGIGRVGGQAVDSFGRDADWLAGNDRLRGFGDARVGEGNNSRDRHAELVSASMG
jgi:hypothetical protein